MIQEGSKMPGNQGHKSQPLRSLFLGLGEALKKPWVEGLDSHEIKVQLGRAIRLTHPEHNVVITTSVFIPSMGLYYMFRAWWKFQIAQLEGWKERYWAVSIKSALERGYCSLRSQLLFSFSHHSTFPVVDKRPRGPPGIVWTDQRVFWELLFRVWANYFTSLCLNSISVIGIIASTLRSCCKD
jgi:hypothetical protein